MDLLIYIYTHTYMCRSLFIHLLFAYINMYIHKKKAVNSSC